jgi:hypothetical protein
MALNCFFTNLITWKDPSLSAAFLTVGNAIVLLLLLSGDALSWLQFVIVYGVLPLGLVARLTGLDRSVRFSNAASAAKARNYYEVHVYSQIQGLGLIRCGVFMILIGELVSYVGLPLMVGIVGNSVMLIPLVWEQYGRVAMDQARQIPLKKAADSVRDIYTVGFNTVESLGPLAPSAVGGLMVFMGFVVCAQLFSADSLLTWGLKTCGYIMVGLFALLPASISDKIIAVVVPHPEHVETATKSMNMNDWTSVVKDIVLWENYPQSITAFIVLYSFYFISSYTGASSLLALCAAVGVAFHLAPTVYKEKAVAEANKLIKEVKARIPTPPRSTTNLHTAASPVKAPISPKASQRREPEFEEIPVSKSPAVDEGKPIEMPQVNKEENPFDES